MEFESLLGISGGYNCLDAEAAGVLEELLGGAACIHWGTCVIGGDREKSEGILGIKCQQCNCAQLCTPIGVPRVPSAALQRHGHYDRGVCSGWRKEGESLQRLVEVVHGLEEGETG